MARKATIEGWRKSYIVCIYREPHLASLSPVDYELSQSVQFRAHLPAPAFTSSSRRLRAAPRLLRAKLRALRAAPHHLLAVTSYRSPCFL